MLFIVCFFYPIGQAIYDLLYFMQHLQKIRVKIKLFKIWNVEYMEKVQSLDKISCVQNPSYAYCTCALRILLYFQR